MSERHASDEDCIECGEQAEVFWPCIDPDIVSHPYCRECMIQAEAEVWMRLFEMGKRDRERDHET